jgi:hypothetical protein
MFCAWQLYSAIAEGTVLPFTRGRDDWVTYRTSPGWFVGSVVLYALALALFGAAVIAVLHDHWRVQRRRARPPLDSAIRQRPEER